MILAILVVAEFIHLIQGTDVCPPAPPFDPSCLARLIIPGCSSDQNCTKPGTKCCTSECNVLQCLESVPGNEEPRPGVCPPLKTGVICNALFISDCTGKDSECKTPGYKCCPGLCNSQRCQEPITGDRPGCPAINPDLRCFVFRQECNSDSDCDEGQQCCFQPSCGTTCQDISYPSPDPVCPPYNEDAICTLFDEQCDSSDDCKEGDMCCPVECGTACKTPYRPPNDDPKCEPVVCDLNCESGFAKDENGCEICRCIQKTCPPRVQLCIFIPPGACSKENFLIIDGGVKCPLCPSIIPCNKDCLLPVQPGPCEAAIKRYYFDVNRNSCTEFIYGGCQGNNNNFNSLQECEEKCITKPSDPIVKLGKCPSNTDPHLVCPAVVRPGDCSDDSSCPGDQKCCRVGCFKTCVNPDQDCPPVCEIFCPFGHVVDSNGCSTCKCKPGPDCPPVCHIYCEFGNVIDSNGCPTCKCKGNPCPPNPRCPIPPQGPPGTCPPLCRFIYEEIDGVKCKIRCEIGPAGPQGPPCPPTNCIEGPTEPLPPPPPACEKGSPLSTVQCGLGGETCPNGYYCNSDVCCQIPCKNGTPHPTLTCGQVAGSNNCPPGYSCLVHPADAYFACCPDDATVTGSCPNGNPLPNIFCGRGPGRQDCPPGYSCNVDPVDRFAVCCSNNECPLPKCIPPPPMSCTEPDFRIFNGVKCTWCPKIVPCKGKICPAVPADSICNEYKRDCNDDSSCPHGLKCCIQGCSYVCVYPI